MCRARRPRDRIGVPRQRAAEPGHPDARDDAPLRRTRCAWEVFLQRQLTRQRTDVERASLHHDIMQLPPTDTRRMAWLSRDKISSAGLTSWPTKKFAMDDTTFSEMYYGRHAPASSMQQASTPHASAERTRARRRVTRGNPAREFPRTAIDTGAFQIPRILILRTLTLLLKTAQTLKHSSRLGRLEHVQARSRRAVRCAKPREQGRAGDGHRDEVDEEHEPTDGGNGAAPLCHALGLAVDKRGARRAKRPLERAEHVPARSERGDVSTRGPRVRVRH